MPEGGTMSHSTAVKTRAEMEAEYGSVPFVSTVWTIHRAHASVTFITDDGGEHWAKKSTAYAAERARHDEQALEMQRIQRDLK
jgi:hypothetical protein